VEREQFNNLLTNFTSLTEDESMQLVALSKDFPYSQVIRNLAARAAQDSNLPSKENLLHLSAIYSTDRSALKAMMTAPRRERIVQTQTLEIQELPTPPDEERENLYEQVAQDIAQLQETKQLYEKTIERLEQESLLPLPEKIKQVNTPPTDTLIEEIKSTKKKIKPESVKQKEQIEIIDQFIKTQPSIPRPKANVPAPTPQDSDLSEPSSLFGENIVSETLVEILLKQGKKEKAIDALKKLIWKFPQKKAYFAAQIEELRK
jgi:hypothetical protein